MAKQELLIVEEKYVDIHFGGSQKRIQKLLDAGYKLVGAPAAMDHYGSMVFTLVRETESEAD